MIKLSRTSWRDNPWLSLAAATWLESCVGVGHGFGLWSQTLKTSLGFTQRQLTLVAACKDLGSSVGIFAGFAADFVPPWTVLLIGGVLNTLGFSAVWLAIRGRLSWHGGSSAAATWQVGLAVMLACNGGNWLNTAGMVTMVKNFPGSSGLVIGYIKGFIGLSAAIFVQLYYATCAPVAENFLLLAAFLPSLVALISSPLIRRHPATSRPTESRTFVQLAAGSASLALLLLLCSLLRQAYELPDWSNKVLAALVLLLMCYPFLRLRNVPEPSKQDLSSSSSSSSPASSSLAPPDPEPQKPEEEEEVEERLLGSSDPGPEIEGGDGSQEPHALLRAISALDFWILFLSLAMGCGSAVAVNDNMGQVALVLGRQPGVFVSLYSVSVFFGFLCGGFLSEHLLRLHGCPRPFLGAAALLLLSSGLFCLATAVQGVVQVAAMAVGFSYGCLWAVGPATLADLFGVRFYASLYSWLIMANPAGAFVLSALVVGPLYDAEAAKENAFGFGDAPPGSLNCHGGHCFRKALLVLGFASVLATGLMCLLMWRTRTVYAQGFRRRGEADP